MNRDRTGRPEAWELPVLALILMLVALLFWPALDFPFVSLDDYYGVVENPGLRDLSWKSVGFLYFQDQRDFRYFPTAYLSLAIDNHLFGMDARFFHLTNVLLHLANTALVFVFIRRLDRDARVAAIASLLFGIHPLQIESVAWVSGRKNVLFLFFFLLSALAYLGHRLDRDTQPLRSRLKLAASVLLFALSATSKTTAVTLPAALLLVDAHLAPRLPRNPLRFVWENLPSKLPYLAVIGFVTLMTRHLARRSPFGAPNEFSPSDWFWIGGHNLFFYVWKAIVPTGLVVFNPLPVTTDASLPLHFHVFTLLSLSAIALCIWSWGRHRALFFGIAWYLVTILPMALLQIVFDDVPILVADRYFYQSAIGIFYLVGVGAVLAWQYASGWKPVARVALGAAAAGVVALLFALASNQRDVWRGTIPLYEQVVRYQPSDAFFQRLALEYDDAGDTQKAFQALDDAEAARYRVFFSQVFVDQFRISDLYRRKGDFAAAARFLSAAIESTPNAIEPANARTPLAFRYLAWLYDEAHDSAHASAARMAAETAQVDPRHYFESNWLVVAPDTALSFLERRVREAPNDAVAWYYLGRGLQLYREPERAAACLDRAKQLGFPP